MKSLTDIIGLKIISINQGKQISKVKDVIINPESGSISFFIIDQPSDYLGARIISYKDIVGLGDFALIIPDSKIIQDVAHNQLAIDLLKKEIKVIGSHILTTKGSLIGQVTEIMIEEETGKIAACMVSNPQGRQEKVSCDTVVTYGKEIILLEQNPANPAPKPQRNTPSKAKPRQDVDNSSEVDEKEILKRKIAQLGQQNSLMPDSESKSLVFPEGFNVFEQKQLQFLLGKTLDKDVLLDNGSSLKAGEKITAELLSEVKTRNTLMQITAHVVK